MPIIADNNLVVGSGYGIVMGAPLLVFVSLAARSTIMRLVIYALAVVYLAARTFVIVREKSKKEIILPHRRVFIDAASFTSLQ